MALKLIVPPIAEPIALEDAKTHVKEEYRDNDYLIADLIVAAREYCEAYQNRAYFTQTYEFWLDGWPNRIVNIPRPPLQKVESIKFYTQDNVEHILSEDNYFVDNKNEPGRVIFGGAAPEPLRQYNSVSIRFVAGYGDAAKVPAVVKQAMLLLIGHWYDTREAATTGIISREIEFSVSSLLWLRRVVPI